MVPRGAHGDERHGSVPTVELGQRDQAGPRGAPRRRPRIGSGIGVGVECAATGGAERLELGQVRRRVHPRQLVERGLADDGVHDVVLQTDGTHALHGREHASLLFGVAAPSVVLGETCGTADDERGHTPPSGVIRRVSSRAATAARDASVTASGNRSLTVPYSMLEVTG